MNKIRDFLATDEKLCDKVVLFNPDEAVDYTIYILAKDGEQTYDDVLLEIVDKTEKCVMIGGNKLELSVLNGFGRLAMVDLKSGDTSEIFLEQGMEAVVPPDNTLFWYENLGDDELVVRDHSDKFDPDNERRLTEVVRALTGTSE